VTGIEELRERIARDSPLSPERTEEIVRTYFQRTPLRTAYAVERYPLATSKVLDVGCSYGTSLFRFGPGSVGLDNNAEAVAFCAGIGLDARRTDVESAIDVPAAAFDYIWLSDILEHIEAPRLLLRRLAPLVVQGGRLLLQTSVVPSSAIARRLLRAHRRQPFDADVHYHQWTRHTMAHLLERAGWRVVRAGVLTPPRLSRFEAFIHPAIAPRLLIEAVVDPKLVAVVNRSEARNRQVG
jgi:SAM-dependent methyltransferase